MERRRAEEVPLAEVVDARTRRRAADLEASLLTLDGRTSSSGEHASSLVELLDADRGGAYGLRSEAGLARVDFLNVANVDRSAYARDLDEALRDHPLRTVLYDPVRPEPSQRNRVVSLPADHILRTAVSSAGTERLLRRHRWLAHEHQLRVLVCDGPSLLAWVGVLRAGPFRRRERRLLRAVVPALKRRLWVERQLAHAPLALGTLAAAVDAIGAAAFLLREPAVVVHANAAGRAFMDRDRSRPVERIRAAGPGAFTWTALRLPGLPPHWLVVQSRPPADPAPRVDAVARRAHLTTRQREVLSRIVTGQPNKTIAAALGVSDAAVELHVTSLLERLACASRSELIARFWSRAP